MLAKLNSKGLTKALVIPDLHVPYHDKKTLKAVEDYMEVNAPWDILIYLGDVLDFDHISDFTTPRMSAGKTIAADYGEANTLLGRHKRLSKAKKIYWIQGNHDERVERLIDKFPHLTGSVEVEKNIPMIVAGEVEFVPYQRTGEGVSVGDAHFIHGMYVNEFHAKTHVLNYGRNIFYGHLHDTQSYLKVWATAETIVGQSLGCLCKLDQGYMRGRPSKWVQAFGVFYFQPNGNFTYYVPMIFNHKFVGPDGRLYGG